MRRLILALIVVGLLLVAAPARVGAGAQWCDTDPLVLITTPRGTVVPVFVTSGALGTEHLPAVLLAGIAATTSPTAGGRATAVRLEVIVPDDLFASAFPVRTVASTGPLATGAIYARADGRSGRAMVLNFTLDVP